MIQLRLSIYLQSFLLARRFVANMGLMNILRTYLTCSYYVLCPGSGKGCLAALLTFTRRSLLTLG